MICLREGKLKDIIIYCAAGLGEKTYEYLASKESWPVCFCDNANDKQGMRSLDLPIYNYETCKSMFQESIWYIANGNYGKMCTIKNQLLRDGISEEDIFWSMDIEGFDNKGNIYLQTVLKDKEIVLVGRKSLCEDLKWIFEESRRTNKIVCLTYESDFDGGLVQDYVSKHTESLYFIVNRGCYATDTLMRRKIYNCLRTSGAVSISIRYSLDLSYIEDIKHSMVNSSYGNRENKTTHQNSKRLEIENINTVLYHIGEAHSGMEYFSSLFEKHENVLYLGHTAFQGLLWLLIKEVSREEIKNDPNSIVIWIRKFVSENTGWGVCIEDEKLFIEEFKTTVKGRNVLSEKDIFIAVYIAYFYMKKKIYNSNIEPIIYFEPHSNGDIEAIYMGNLIKCFTTVKQLKIVRNPINRVGSYIRNGFQSCHRLSMEYIRSFQYWGNGESMLRGDRITIRFEDIKLFPKEVLAYVCKEINLPLDEQIFYKTEKEDKRAAGYWGLQGIFDVKPVYYNYEEYLSSFDRLRLDILYSEKEKAYGYAFLDLNKCNFTKEQLLEWFKIPYKFEDLIDFISEEQKKVFRQELYQDAFYILNTVEQKKLNYFDKCYIYSPAQNKSS